MLLRDIETPITSLSGIGPERARLFANLNIFTIADLLSHWPRDWEDRTRQIYLKDFDKFPKVHTLAKVTGQEWFGFGAMRTLKILITDGTANAELLCFNRPFIGKNCPVGALIRVTGSFIYKYGGIQSSAFETDLISLTGDLPSLAAAQDSSQAALSGSGVFSLYPLTADLTQAMMRKAIAQALKAYGKGIENEIPEEVIARQGLLSKQQAVFLIHQPKTMEEVERAKKTLIFEELYLFQLALAKRSIERRGSLPSLQGQEEQNTQSISQQDFFASLSPKQSALIKSLPFELTADQKKVLLEINNDIDRGYKSQNERELQVKEQTDNGSKAPRAFSMARLLQGDVGSGKTLVAFAACLRIIDWGGQCAILAPTELLSRQHAENAARALQSLGVRLAFLTGNIKAAGRNALLEALKQGEIDIIIGTHALFSKNVQYKNLKLAIIDEQHRFGVLQRGAIIDKGRKSIANTIAFPPHLLMMSATPIPQTLALTVFGDLDVSVIKTMPAGRKPIKTHLTRRGSEENVYSFVRKEIAAGRQAYFIYPLIEDNEENTLKSAETMHQTLSRKIFPQYSCALIHSKIDEDEQKAIMDNFHAGKTNILVATSVVEVGVDVPNASCMVIEQAERFGLAALHQLRGRVGRGNCQSHCFLIYSKNLTEIGKERLKALYENTDGFVIAEQDLALRGPGEVLGIQQSGYLTLSIADPVRDSAILQIARTEAFAMQRMLPSGSCGLDAANGE